MIDNMKRPNKRMRMMLTMDNDDNDDKMPDIVVRNNHIYFTKDITYKTAFELNQTLREVCDDILEASIKRNIPSETPIYLHITTYGGCIHAAFSVVDCINSLKVPVYTVVDGFVASAGTLISLAGKKRYIRKNAYMLIHELRSGVWGKMSSINEEYANLTKMMEHIIDYYTDKTPFKRKRIEKILMKDIIWNANECIEKGLIDEIMILGEN